MDRPSLPADRVSRNSKLMSSNPREVKIAMIRTDGTTTYCSCNGWYKLHGRRKVREKAAQRHLDRKHGGAGLWL